MSKQRNPKKFSIRTGRGRRLTFSILGVQATVDVHERVEVVDIVTRARIPMDEWYIAGIGMRVPLGATPVYFELRNDTGERVRDYAGLVKAVAIK